MLFPGPSPGRDRSSHHQREGCVQEARDRNSLSVETRGQRRLRDFAGWLGCCRGSRVTTDATTSLHAASLWLRVPQSLLETPAFPNQPSVGRHNL